MSHQPDVDALEAAFITADRAWRVQLDDESHAEWRRLWLGPECALLKYARGVRCRFPPTAQEALQNLIAADHQACAAFHLHLDPKNSLTDSEREDLDQSIRLMTGLLHGVQAAAALCDWSPARPLPGNFVTAAVKCLRAYHDAWPLVTQAVDPTARRSAEPFQPDADPYATALHQLAVHSEFFEPEALDVSTWLTVRRLLEHLQPIQDAGGFENSGTTAPTFSTKTRILLVNDAEPPDGLTGPLTISTACEGQFGVYLDPVALGQTLVNRRMLDSLKLGWRAAKPELQAWLNDTRQSAQAIRLAPHLPDVVCLDGGSAGGLFACGIYAAGKRIGLNTDASASVALEYDAEMLDSDEPLDLGALRVVGVSESSIPPKLAAAARDGIKHVALESEQEAWAREHGHVPPSVVPHPVDDLGQVFKHLTGDARIERVLDAWCSDRVKEWEAAWTRPWDEQSLLYYVRPHYGILNREKVAEEKYERVAGDTETAVLTNLLRAGGDRLCVYEGPGAGKTTFSRRVQAFLCSRHAQEAFYDGKPALAVRWEDGNPTGEVRPWPADFVESLRDAVRATCHQEGISPNEVVDWALQKGHVVLILDALDQVHDEQVKIFKEFLTIAHQQKWSLRVILTGRSQAVEERRRSLLVPFQIARIEPFDAAQQYRYLRGPETPDRSTGDPWLDRDLSSVPIKPLVDPAIVRDQDVRLGREKDPRQAACLARLRQSITNYDRTADLFGNPDVLRMVREIAMADDDTLPRFESRSDLRLQVSTYLLERSVKQLFDREPAAGVVPRLQAILAAVACEMMLHDPKVHRIESDVTEFLGAAAIRLDKPVATDSYSISGESFDDEWKFVFRVTNLRSQLLIGSEGRVLAWPDRRAMEFYCGLHLERNRQATWADPGAPGGAAPELKPWAANEDWHEAFRDAIEMPMPALRTEAARVKQVLLASLSPLFDLPDGRLRPAELMYRAWPLLEETPAHLRAFAKQPPLLPGGDAVIARYRQASQELLAEGNASARAIVEGFRPIPAGCFLMGSPKEEKDRISDERQHWVEISRTFEMHQHQVTNAVYELFDPAHRAKRDKYSDQDDQPAIYVSWYEAIMFCRWLGTQYRLPTEGEWEYACRAGKSTPFHFGSISDGTQSNIDGNYPYGTATKGPYLGKTSAVGSYQDFVNAFGLYDMHGNLWEWCQDWYAEYDENTKRVVDPTGPDSGGERVLRGGSWDLYARYTRSAYRSWGSPDGRYNDVGFRLARTRIR